MTWLIWDCKHQVFTNICVLVKKHSSIPNQYPRWLDSLEKLFVNFWIELFRHLTVSENRLPPPPLRHCLKIIYEYINLFHEKASNFLMTRKLLAFWKNMSRFLLKDLQILFEYDMFTPLGFHSLTDYLLMWSILVPRIGFRTPKLWIWIVIFRKMFRYKCWNLDWFILEIIQIKTAIAVYFIGLWLYAWL